MSSAREDFAHEEDISRSTRLRRAARSAAPTPPVSPASLFPSLRLRNLVGQHAQLPTVEHRTIHHADQNLFDGPVAEPVDDALNRFRRNPSACLSRMVDIGSPIHRVGRVALAFSLRSTVRTVDSLRRRDSRSRTASAVKGPSAQTSCMTSRSRSPSSGRLSFIFGGSFVSFCLL